MTGPTGRAALPIVVVVAIFAGAVPQMVDQAAVWAALSTLTRIEMSLLVALALGSLASHALVWMAAVPGLSWWRATLVEQASTAVTNTIPAGFAFGVGTTATMFHSFGFSAGVITRAVVLAALWNNLVKLGMPVLALTGLALTGSATRALLAAAALGAALLLLALTALVLVLTHGGAAAALARTGERWAGRLARLAHRSAPSGWVPRIDRFRSDSLVVLRRRWPWLTAAAVVSHVSLFVLLLACVGLVDGPDSSVSWLLVLAVFSITRLVTLVQITPGALGVSELSYLAGLTAVGMDASAAGAAILVFRFLTWFVPIPLGAAAWLLWRRGADGPHGRREPATVAGRGSAVEA
jgi:uncharacterized membrane protein YbhN (UPF0104 family)